MKNLSINELSEQLSHPQGEKGIEIAKQMSESNLSMILSSFKELQILSNERILELGHGNASYLPLIQSLNENFNCYGLEVSNLMMTEAQKGDYPRADFSLFDGESIPFQDNFFEKITSTNTIYFWKSPKTLISEIHRTLKPKGLVTISFAEKSFMEKLPFTQENFNLYDVSQVHSLFSHSFELINSHEQRENVVSKNGDNVERVFYTLTFQSI